MVLDNSASDAALKALEKVEVDEKSRPKMEVRIKEVTVLVDPFERFLDDKEERERVEREKEHVRKMGGREDERVTWTGKRVRLDGGMDDGAGDAGGGVGRYLNSDGGGEGKGVSGEGNRKGVMEEWEGGNDGDGDGDGGARVRKKVKGGGGFGNFDNW